MKTILHLRSTFHAGGTENLLVRLFNQPNDAFRIVLVLMKPGQMMYHLRDGKNRVVHLYRRGKIDIAFIYRLFQLVRSERPFALHTHQEIELFYALLIKLFFPSIRLYHQIHLHNPTDTLWFQFERVVCRLFVHCVLAVSYTLKSYLVQNGFRKDIQVIYNIIQPTNLMTNEEKAAFLEKIHYRSGEKLIGMIGNFVKEKDQLTLARAFRRLLDEQDIIRAKLVFIGRESTTSTACRNVFLPDEIGRVVFFVGPVANAAELISNFSVMVFSSRQETFGMAALETLLYKVPLITSNIPVMKELSNNGKYFELFPFGDDRSLAEKIMRILMFPPSDEQLENSKKYVLDTFSAAKAVQRLAQIYS